MNSWMGSEEFVKVLKVGEEGHTAERRGRQGTLLAWEDEEDVNFEVLAAYSDQSAYNF